jgi:hypothetical protein
MTTLCNFVSLVVYGFVCLPRKPKAKESHGSREKRHFSAPGKSVRFLPRYNYPSPPSAGAVIKAQAPSVDSAEIGTKVQRGSECLEVHG